MTTKPATTISLACVAGAIPATERKTHFALIQTLFGEMVLEAVALPDGYRFQFPASAIESLGRWMTNERKCCPFLTFTLEITPADGPVSLTLTGPEGTREFLEAELPIRRAANG